MVEASLACSLKLWCMSCQTAPRDLSCRSSLSHQPLQTSHHTGEEACPHGPARSREHQGSSSTGKPAVIPKSGTVRRRSSWHQTATPKPRHERKWSSHKGKENEQVENMYSPSRALSNIELRSKIYPCQGHAHFLRWDGQLWQRGQGCQESTGSYVRLAQQLCFVSCRGVLEELCAILAALQRRY